MPNNVNVDSKFGPENLDAYLEERRSWLYEAAVLISGEEATVEAVFAEPEEVRADSEGLELTAEQEVSLREVAGRFGIGGERNVLSQADHQIIEGGLAWKIDAEAKITDEAKSIIFAGSPHRKIVREDEVDYLKNRLGGDVLPQTEYELAKVLASAQEGFVPQGEEILPFGYDINSNFELINQPVDLDNSRGQLVKIGENNGVPVLILRVDRENFVNEDGENKYRNQPDSAALMGFVADVLSASGDDESSVGLNTSSTYASRAVDAVRAGLGKERQFSVGMYGRQTIADVKGEPTAEPTAINQIPGELRVMHDKLAKLSQETQDQ